jgi:hypothetical protein
MIEVEKAEYQRLLSCRLIVESALAQLAAGGDDIENEPAAERETSHL